jgi:hypothetical protein
MMDEANVRQMNFLRERLKHHIEKDDSFQKSEIVKLDSAFNSYTISGDADEVVKLRRHLEECLENFEDLIDFGCVRDEEDKLVSFSKEQYYSMLKSILKHIDQVIPGDEKVKEIKVGL